MEHTIFGVIQLGGIYLYLFWQLEPMFAFEVTDDLVDWDRELGKALGSLASLCRGLIYAVV